MPKITRKILKAIKNYLKRIVKKFIKNFPKSLLSVILIPILVWFMLNIILSFSFIASIGYLIYCLINIEKMIEDIKRPIVWGAAYIIGAIIFSFSLSNIVPLLSKRDASSIFSILIIIYIIIVLWNKKEEMKKK